MNDSGPKASVAPRKATTKATKGVLPTASTTSADVKPTARKRGAGSASKPQRSPSHTPAGMSQPSGVAVTPRPSGRDQVIDAIIDAAIELCVAGGPDEVSLRRVAERANVNYGLVHRHFRTKDAVVRAAIARAYQRGFQVFKPAPDMKSAIRAILFEGSHTVSKVLAWGFLQGITEEVLPDESSWILLGLCELAAKESSGKYTADSPELRALIGTLMATLLGWRLFEPYLAHGLGLEGLDQNAIYRLILPILERLIDLEVHS